MVTCAPVTLEVTSSCPTAGAASCLGAGGDGGLAGTLTSATRRFGWDMAERAGGFGGALVGANLGASGCSLGVSVPLDISGLCRGGAEVGGGWAVGASVGGAGAG